MVDLASPYSLQGLNARIFQYERPLQEDKSEIRVLTIQPGKFEEPLVTNLRIVSLLSNPTFEVLSYAWGDGSQKKNILINGAVKEFTTNLESALRHLRPVGISRDIWVDAICIDQNGSQENNEKHWQLPLMADIYQKSTHTIVWLGEANEDLESRFKHIEAIPGSLKLEDLENLTKRDLNKDDSNIVCSLIEAKFCFNSAFDCSWWSRSWTLQEVVLLETDAIIVCGKNTTTWSHFCHCADLAYIYRERMAVMELPTGLDEEVHRLWLSGPSENGQGLQHNPDARKYMRRNWYKLPAIGRGFEPLSLLHITRYLRATDPRDKVYCLLGLFKKEFSKSITVDYNAYPMKIFEDVARKCWLSKSISGFYSFDFESNTTSQAEFPSWVPDFSLEKTIYHLSWEVVLGMSKVIYITSHPDEDMRQSSGHIKVRATPLDTIFGKPSTSASEKEDMLENITQIRKYYKDVVQTLRSADSLLIEQNFAKFFMTTDYPNAFQKMQAVPPELKPTVKELAHLFLDQGIENGQRFRQYCVEHFPSIDTEMLGSCVHMAIARQYKHIWMEASFLVGRRGLFIGGPKHAQPGDLVVAISGMTCPMILRANDNDTFRVIVLLAQRMSMTLWMGIK